MSDNTSYYDLYKALKADGAVQGDWNSFHKFVGASGKQGYLNRKRLYDALKADGAVQSNSYEEFHMKLYRGGQASMKAAKQRQEQQQTQTTAQQPSKPQTAAQMAMAMGGQKQEPIDYLKPPKPLQSKPQWKNPKYAPRKVSPFVDSLYVADEEKRMADAEMIKRKGYTSRGGAKEMLEKNKALDEAHAKDAADMIVNDERRRRNQPIVKTETPADEYIVKTQGQWEDEISDAADQLVNASGDFIKNSINNEYKQATLNAEKEIRSNDAISNPFLNPSSAALISTQIANKYESPDKILSSLQNSIKANINNVLPEAEEQAVKLGVPSDVYLENVVLPKMIQKAVGEFQKTEVAKRMPKNDLDYFVQEATSSNYLAKLGTMLLKTKSQRQFDEEALARTNAGANPNYNPGTALRIAADVTGMAADPIFGASAKLGGAVAGKVIGNSTKIGAMMANGNLAQRLTLGGAQAVTSGGVTGFAFDSVGSAIQNYSTGEDTSLGNTLKMAAKGGLHGAVNFATMSAVGVPLAQLGRNIGIKAGSSFWGNTGRAVGKIGLEAGKTYMEGMGMYLGSYVTGKMDGATDANGKPIEFDLWNGTMESLPTAIGFRLQHAIGGLKGGRKDKNGKDLGWAKSTLVNMKDFLTSDKEKSSLFLMTDEERKQIMRSYHDTMGYSKFNFDNVVTVAKNAKKKPKTMQGANYDEVKFEENPTQLADVESDMEVVHNVYGKIMADPEVSWDAKAKFSAMVTGIMPSARPMADHYRFDSFMGTTYMKEYAANGELLSERAYKNPSERDAMIFKSKATKENLRLHNSAALLNVVDRNNANMQNAFFQQKRKEGLSEQEIIQGMSDTESKIFDEFADFCYENGSFMKEVERTAAINDVTVEYILREMEKDPMKRDEMGQDICTQLRQSIEATVFSQNKVHEEQSQLSGKDVAEENGLGTEQPNGEAAKQELNNLTQAENELEEAMNGNDTFKQMFEQCKKQGLTSAQTYDMLIQSGLTQEEIAPLANYINANARVQGMQNATQQMIEQKVSAYVQDWCMHGTLNGEKQNGEQAVWVQDGSGRTLVLGSGEVAFDSVTGRAKEGVGDMIVCLDPNKGEMVYLKAKDVTLFQTQKAEDFGNEYRQKLQQINSQPYEQAAREQAEQNANKEEGTATQVTPGQSNEGAGAVTPNLPEGKGTENNSSVQEPSDSNKTTDTVTSSLSGDTALTQSEGIPSADKDTNNSPNSNENNTTLTFSNGAPVPMKTDSKGRPTPDYENMTAEQSAEVMQNQFGESAEKVADARIKKAEKAVKDAEKMKVDYSGEDADILEQQAVKDATIAAAHAQLKKAKAIKEALNKPKDSVAGGEVDTTGRYEQERKQGYRIGEGNVRYDRQKSEEVGGIRGKDVEVAFSPTEKVKGHAKLVELDTVQGSHSNGILNPYHFGPDWQPKDRGSQASKVEATKMAANIDPQQITGSANAFIGSAPSVNERHETIQGNNRVEALKQMYSSNPEQAAKYKQWLIDHAAEFGLNPEDIAKMKKPVIVNELPVDDVKAKELGQMMASGFESGGKRIPEISATINKLGDKVENLANVLLAEGSLGEDAKLSDLINQNANRALEYLYKNGFIDNTEYENLASDPTTRRQWLENVLKTSLFDGDKTTEAAFNSLPGNAQKAVLATFMRDMNSSKEDRIKPNIQKSFEAFNELNQLDTFKNAKDVESARAAIQAELLNGSNNMYGETPIRDKYTNFELELAALYKGLKSQKELSGLFGKFFDAVQGATRREGNVFEQGSTEPLSKDEAIEKVFGTDNKLANDRRRETEPPASSGEGDGNRNGESESESEPEVKVKKAIKRIATEITKQTGIEVVTDENEAQKVLDEAESNGLEVKKSIEAYGAVIDWGYVPNKARLANDEWTTIIMQNNRAYIDELDKLGEGETIEHYVDANGYLYTFRVDKNHHIYMDEAIPKTSSANIERINELKNYYNEERARHLEKVRSDRGETQSELGRPADSDGGTIGGRNSQDSAVGRGSEGTDTKGNVERNTSRPEQSGSQIKEFRSKNGEVYGFVHDGKIYLDTKKMKPETPLHEYTHLWTEALKNGNPKEWENVKKLFDEVEGLKEEVQQLYPELKGDDLYEEMITTYSGREGAKKLEETVRNLAAKEGKSVEESSKAKGFIDKVKDALNTYWKGVADMLGIHFTSAEEVADKVLADWASGVNPKEVKAKEEKDDFYDIFDDGSDTTETPKDKAKHSKAYLEFNNRLLLAYQENARTFPREAVVEVIKKTLKGFTEEELNETYKGLIEFGKTNGGLDTLKVANLVKAEIIRRSEPSKDPMQGIRNAAESYHSEKLDAERKAFEEAKASGDELEIKRTRDELKHQLDEKYKAQGMGLVQRRKEIAKEIGKAEAEKIEKPWEEMDGEERLATAEKSPLTEDEIRNNTSEENQDLIEDAIDYLNGNHGFAKQVAYLKIYEDVRNRHENAPDNSGAEDGAQLAPADTTGSEGMGLGTGRGSRGTDEQLDSGTGGEPSSRERESGESDKTDPSLPTGEPSDKQGEGATPDMGAVPTRGADSEGGSAAGKDGNKSKQGGRRGGDRPAKPNAKRKPTAKQGTTWRGRTESEIKKEAKEAKAGLKAALAEMMKRGRGEASLSLAGLNSKQIEYVPELMKAVKRYGMSLIDQGIYKIKDWMSNIREGIHDDMKAMGFSDQDIDDFIDEMWNSKMTMDGETHTIAEWSSIYGNQKLREKLGEELGAKYQKQMDAEPIEVKVGDRKNIEETLPFLLPQQQEDVLKAETQFFGKEHTDREHAYGKGYMFTNGTGTGKTYTGLGIAKRLAKQGKGRILFVTPSQPKVSDWIKDGKNLGLNIRSLEDWAKERGTTATTESGDGMVITTYANMRANKKILETEWDAVIYDESHRIMENKKGTETAGSMQHYMVSNRDENHCFLRLQTINPHYQKMRNAADEFVKLRAKEVERIQEEYKQSHPGATKKDVINATHSKLPRDLNDFAPADAMTFPKLGKVYQDFTSAKQYYYNNVEPKLKAQAKNTWKNTKTVFLSATPFNTRENLDYAEGYIFKYPEDDGGRMSGRSRFYLDHFGAAYRYRYNRLEAKTDNPEAIAKQEVAFSDYLQHALGTMSGRIIDSPYDYSRDFPTVAPDHAEDFNNAVEDAARGRYLGGAYSKTIGNYVYGSALFETMKVANTIERIKQHLDAGRKVVIFHRRVETKEPIKPPFSYMLEVANEEIKNMKPGKERNEYIAEVNAFREKHADLLQWEQTLDYSMPREQLAKVFGKDNVLFFSGKENGKTKSKAVDTFNDDNSGKNIIVIQEASGKEGISLHDTTGNHQRVLITLGLPQSPITALQIEGRTYRIGNKSNAIFEYPILGLNSEMILFGEKFNNQVSTTENLALGSQARNLRESFANGVLEHSGIVPIDQQGVGGKEFDAPKQQSEDPYGDAVLDYYSNQKLNRNNREGIDYFPTPEPLGYKMVEWANMNEGDTALEPSAGHGAIARYVPKENQLLSIEPSQSLFTKLQLKAGGLGRKFLNNTFENYDIVNKHDVVVMNPPFGTAGVTAIAHLDKAFRHLDEGGRVVAIIPRGSTDKKFDKWYDEQKNIAMRAEVDLPDIVFQQAGTNVRCRVVVLDKITDAELRGKAGYPEKIDLSGHYDKIEDFFEDLRDVQIPDRIIDTQMKTMKKARGFKKELESIKGISVSIEKNGISVFDKNVYRDYSITFPSGKQGKEWMTENYSGIYEAFDQQQRTTYNEHSKAALEEMKRLTCKLAGMSEEEMQKYISDKKNGGVHFREERGVQYSSGEGSKDVKNGRIIPLDVDNSVSSQIEKKFDDAVENETKDYSDAEKADFKDVLDLKVREFSHMRASDIENQLKAYEYDYREWSTKFGGNGNGKNLIRRKAAEYRAATIAAERELDYRKARAEAIRDNYGLQGGRQTSIDALAKIFEKDNRGQDKVREGLFQKASSLLKKLGTEITVNAEAPDVNKNALGSSGIDRDINLYLDTATRTSVKDGELATTILHEMIHQATNGAINLVKKGKAEGLLTPKQIEGVNTILDIYNKIKGDKERFKENTYGLKDEYELTAQMADPRQRKAMDLSVWDRVVNAAHEFTRKGDRSILQRLKDAVKKLFEVSDKDKMDKAINDIMDDFNETVDDISMNEIDKDGFANSPVKISDKAPVVMKRIVDVSKKIGGKVNMVNSPEEITNKRAKEEIEAGKNIQGWYDEKTGKVHLYMPNIHDSYTAEKTIWHEVVGHKGMRELFGEDRFDKFLRSLWYDLDKPENASLKKLVDEERKSNPLNIYDAIEEGVARLAEGGHGDAGFWINIKNKVSNFFREIGYHFAPNTKDVKYLLWLSKNLQKNPNDPYYKMRAEAVKYRLDHEDVPEVIERNGMLHDNDGKSHDYLLDLSPKDYEEATDGKVHFRTSPMAASKIEEYNRILGTKTYAFKESTVDNMQSLQEAIKLISGEKKVWENIPSAFNPLQAQNRISSVVQQKADAYDRKITKPLDDVFQKVVSATGGKDKDEKLRNAQLYMVTKHGLERNRVFFVRDAIRDMKKDDSQSSKAETLRNEWTKKQVDLATDLEKGKIRFDEYLNQMDEWICDNVDKTYVADEHDYSGFHGLQGKDKSDNYDDKLAIDSVMSAESQLGDGLVKDFLGKEEGCYRFRHRAGV